MWEVGIDRLEWIGSARAVVLPDGDVLRVIPKDVVRVDVYCLANHTSRRIILSINQYFGEAFAMSVLRNGCVLIVNSRGEPQELDTDTGVFTKLDWMPLAAGTNLLKWSTQATMPSGDVLHLSSDGVSVFSSDTKQWAPAPNRPPFFDVPSPIEMCEMVALRGGQLFLIGVHADGTGLTYLYTEATDTWTKFPGSCDYSVRRVAAMLDGRALVCKLWGGIDVFDPVNGVWSPVTIEQCTLHMPYFALPLEFPTGGVGIVGRALFGVNQGQPQPRRFSHRLDVYKGNSAWTPASHRSLPARIRRRAAGILLVSLRIGTLGNLPYMMLGALSTDRLM